MTHLLPDYSSVLEELKREIRAVRLKAAMAANSELLQLYWKMGNQIIAQESREGWGAKVIDRLSADLRQAFPDMQGISPRNLRYMKTFAQAYPDPAILQVLLAKLPWYHHITLLDKVKSHEERLFYVHEAISNGWSRDGLVLQIESDYYQRKGKALSNFDRTLPNPQSDLARQTFKDPYLFDFLTLSDKYQEKDVENGLVKHITEFLLELGAGFAYVGKQVRLEVSGRDFFLDLLFYHLKLRSYVIIELKTVEFEPEFVGKLSFYLSAVDDLLRTAHDQPSIGLLICKSKDSVIAEYALRDSHKPMGIAEFRINQILPDNLKDSLPTIAQLEEQLRGPEK
jgi:predicted nuclease of restriction endonuclease-like (RecB) superfamily